MSVAPSKGEEYQVAVLVLKHLTEADAGREWPVKAQAAAKSLIDEAGPGNVLGAEDDRA